MAIGLGRDRTVAFVVCMDGIGYTAQLTYEGMTNSKSPGPTAESQSKECMLHADPKQQVGLALNENCSSL